MPRVLESKGKEGAQQVPGQSLGKERGRACELEGEGLSCCPPPTEDPEASRAFLRSPSHPASSRFRQINLGLEGRQLTRLKEPIKLNQEKDPGPLPVLDWITDPQAIAQLVEDVGVMLRTPVRPPGGPAGPSKVT